MGRELSIGNGGWEAVDEDCDQYHGFDLRRAGPCEPFGVGILEAARERCALVLADIPSLREPWEDAAIFVDPVDSRALREVLACLIDAPRVRADLGELARRRAEEHSVMRTGHPRLYQRLLKSVPV